jgi:hypothetical protein
MPIANYNLEYTFNCPQNYGSVGGYNRNNKNYILEIFQDFKLLETVAPKSNETVLFVGCGFGWIAEDWLSRGLGPICAVDTSTWIHNQKHIHAAIPIYNYDVTNPEHRVEIKNLLGLTSEQKIDICITEDCFSGLYDAECVTIAESLRLISNRVIHYITPPAKDPNYDSVIFPGNKKTAEAWKTLLPQDSILMRYSGEFK